MKPSTIHRAIGAAVFILSAVQLFLTAQPTVSFWDPGELSAAASMLQVPHPPGGPLFLIVGRFFYLMPIPGDLGFRMNTVSILASVFSVLFLFLSAVRLLRRFSEPGSSELRTTMVHSIAAAIGALALSTSDTFWFNAVESNYFAASTLLFSMILWLTLGWLGHASEDANGRYLLLICFLVGLSAGVHLMSVLAIFTVVMVYVFRKYVTNDKACQLSSYVLLLHVAVLFAITFVMWSGLTASTPPTSEEASAFDKKFVLIMAAASVVVGGVFWKKVVRRDSIYMPIAIAAIALFTTYPGIIKKLPALVHTLSGNNGTLGTVIVVGMLIALGFLAYWAGKNRKAIIHLAALGAIFVILGFSTYTMIMIRANQHPPMNENNPSTFSSLLTYLNREQYGEFPIFKRRWTNEADRRQTFTNYSSDFDFFWRYQMNHMFTRYLLFNFSGRASHDQDADWNMKQLFAIPLLVGFFGIYTHFRKDWRLAVSLVILFMLMGYLIAFYQNQQEPQPRERDYFYVGAYYLFALWIAIGIQGLVELFGQAVKSGRTRTLVTAGVLVVGLVVIPGRMLATNYYTHDRSRNWVAWDYAYNLLQTCEKDAILFTNGDNDTFPLWYLQDVGGVRRDVRVVNLSLGNTAWYIHQMKERPYYPEAKAVPFSVPDSRIDGLEGLISWQPRKIVLPVPPEVMARFVGSSDSLTKGEGKVEFVMKNTLDFGSMKAIRTQDFLVYNIIETNHWQRPIYFASTCLPESRIGIDEYLRFCGLGWRLVPVREPNPDLRMDGEMLTKNLMTVQGPTSKGPRFGYSYRFAREKGMYYDENDLRMLMGMRSSFRVLAIHLAEARHDPSGANRVLGQMEQLLPRENVPMPLGDVIETAYLHHRLGDGPRFMQYAVDADSLFRAEEAAGRPAAPYLLGTMVQMYDFMNAHDKALELLSRLAVLYPNDPSLHQKIEEEKREVAGAQAAPAK